MAKRLFNAVVRVKHTGNGVAASAPEVLGVDGEWHEIATSSLSERTGTHGTSVTLRMAGRIEWVDIGPQVETQLRCDLCEHVEPTLDLAGETCPSCGAGTMVEEPVSAEADGPAPIAAKASATPVDPDESEADAEAIDADEAEEAAS